MAEEIEVEPDLFKVSEPIRPFKLILLEETAVEPSYDLVPEILITFLSIVNVPVLNE